MPRAIEEDHKHFRDVIDGKLRKELQKYVKTNKFVRLRAKGGKATVSLPSIDIPHFVYGEGETGVGRGPGKEGDVFKKDPQKGEGHEAGEDEGEGILVNVPLEYFLDELQNDLKLPNLKPKPTQTFEDIKIKYNDIALTGPESLRHNRRTLLQALKRQAASGELDKLYHVPGATDPVRIIKPINSDRRYRQYKEIKIPSSNAVIMFGRDGSISMDEEKCDIVSDIAWWIDVWVRRFYEKVERCYFWHDVVAKEVDEDTFYKYRYGGGTLCSSCLNIMAEQFENRFVPEKWNIYCFYFTDGENQHSDNPVFLETLLKKFPSNVCNLFGLTQVLAMDYSGSIKEFVDKEKGKMPNLTTVSVGPEKAVDFSSMGSWGAPKLTEDERNEEVKKAIKALLSEPNVAEVGAGI
jgi:uncharacterized sporulation protein YeaH/YhbH (DUF444 family)